ncbi:unnamed protein product [Chironomus riparius]|uniref:Uncharacterized protein n=1 Tax=Chironomus riparius TaxID=315576 RepID=A0A9N9S1P3_9DIPT|nr:unnamed protein product [Chironomus riparius]
MVKLNVLKSQIACEITQKDELQKNLIVQILCSKRLLSDHLENLEEVVNDFIVEETTKSNYFTFLSTSSAVLSSYGIFHYLNNNIRYLIPCLTGAIPIIYLHKQMNIKQRIFYETQMKDFIKSLDDFEFSVKKATNYINDAQFLKAQADNLKRVNKSLNITIDILNLTKRVVRALYCFLKYLEYCYKIDDKYHYFYQDIDDVDNCKLLTTDFEEEENDPHTLLKNMFGLFAYVQSHLLLRIGFIFATNLQEGKFIIAKKLCDITSKIKHQTTLLPSFLLLQKEESDLQNNIQKLVDTEMNKAISKELVHIRSSTVDFTLKVLSLVLNLKDYQEMLIQLTNNYQNSNKAEMDDVMKLLEAIGSKLSDCSDEQNRMLILMKKYLNKDTEEVKIIAKEIENAENEEKPLKIADENPEQSDDFFYVDPDKENFGDDIENEKEESDVAADDLEEEDLQVKITKKCFKPVLAQLKERIVTIDANMKVREKKVLKEKGIEIIEEPENKLDLADYDSDVDSDWKRQQKFERSRQKYDQNREFLQAKGPINLLSPGKFPVMNSFLSLQEEILE